MSRKRKGILFLCVLSLFLVLRWDSVSRYEMESMRMKHRGINPYHRRAAAAKSNLVIVAVVGYGVIAWYITGKDE